MDSQVNDLLRDDTQLVGQTGRNVAGFAGQPGFSEPKSEDSSLRVGRWTVDGGRRTAGVRVSHQDYDKRPGAGSGSGGSLGHLCDALEKHLVSSVAVVAWKTGLSAGENLPGPAAMFRTNDRAEDRGNRNRGAVLNVPEAVSRSRAHPVNEPAPGFGWWKISNHVWVVLVVGASRPGTRTHPCAVLP
jgi:hypothetical protein